MIDLATLAGSLGVGLLLGAFFLNTIGWLRADRLPYLGLNLLGAAISCWASYRIGFMPFVVLEGTWALVALVGIVRALRGQRAPAH